jgi:hypothetical protein
MLHKFTVHSLFNKINYENKINYKILVYENIEEREKERQVM